MQCSYILAICVSLLLLKLERTAATSVSAGPSQELINAARAVELDEVGLRELWKSRQPLVIRKQNDAGLVTTVTYELGPDGRSISRSRVLESILPARLEDNSASKPREDWEYVPSPGPQLRRPIGESSFGTGNFETNVFDTGFPRSILFPNWELPAGVTPRVTTRTETDGLGRKVTITTRSYSGTLLPGSNVFKQTFPDISEEPGPINTDFNPAQNPNTASFTPSRTAPTDTNSVHHSRPSQGAPVFVPVIDSTPTTQRPSVPLPTLAAAGAGGSDQVIDDFLKQVDLSASEIENSNGEVVKTILDKNGRILTARFVLSTVKGTQEGPQQPKPTK
ncbi:uncharacterized protein LOC6528209 [Drosophila yakuba]|uniref:Uncharacterized protein n=1 Tax=Drosophila yakuba TaxID=7245 RepID=B4P0I9_DROYA|nr:uncharacterized protein LOC6528209 [Drosophila yakuba]EDW88983.1 uncharacterized protein Dyak_GE25137 [Drosophila yakuba]